MVAAILLGEDEKLCKRLLQMAHKLEENTITEIEVVTEQQEVERIGDGAPSVTKGKRTVRKEWRMYPEAFREARRATRRSRKSAAL